ncbi:MAG: hypothetical protein R3B36_21495 [Polyangiaceae bacterium]
MLRIYDVIIDTVAGLRPVMERIGPARCGSCSADAACAGECAAERGRGLLEPRAQPGRSLPHGRGVDAGGGAALDVAVALGYIDGVDDALRDRVGLITNTLLKNARS